MFKKISAIVLSLLLLLCFAACKEEPPPYDPRYCGFDNSYEESVSFDEYEEYTDYISKHDLSLPFVPYEKISFLGEFVKCIGRFIIYPHNTTCTNISYLLIDKSESVFELYVGKSNSSLASDLVDGSLKHTPLDQCELSDNGILHVDFPNYEPTVLFVNSIKYSYQSYDDAPDKLTTVEWIYGDYHVCLCIPTEYQPEAPDTFLGQMLTSFEAAEAGIKALNLAMFEFSDES